MAIRCLVMSPLHNLGQTTVSLLLAQGVTYFGKTSMLLATEANTRIQDYLSVQEAVNDTTRSARQVVQLVEAQALSDDSIIEYAIPYAKNAYYLDMSDHSLVGTEHTNTIRHLYQHSACDVVVCDNGNDADAEETQVLLEHTDMVFIVIDMSQKSIDFLESWLKAKPLKDFANTFVVVNRYNEVVTSMRDFAKKTSLVSSHFCKIHYNPWIQRCCMVGQLQTLLPNAVALDPRVANLSVDVSDLSKCCMSVELVKGKRGF